MARLIKHDGTIEFVWPANGKCFSLKELQGFVDGYIEIIRLSPKRLMVVNEEGRLKGLPFNIRATSMAHTIIVGNVLVCGTSQIK